MRKPQIAALFLLFFAVVSFGFVSWHFFNDDIYSHGEKAMDYVKQFFDKTQNKTEIVEEKITVSPDSVRIYIGIVMAWWKFGERLILRETYKRFNISSNDTVTIRFVLGLPPANDLGIMQFLEWEQERFQDLQILNQTENMNDGKSYEFFAELARWYPTDDPTQRPWDYAMKADDDTLLNLPELLKRMRPLQPRKDLYMGRGTDAYLMGAGYTLSWDLVTWLGENRMEEYMHWDEDQAIGAMLRAGGKGKTWVDLGKQVMDEPSTKNTGWEREYGPDVILVHRLKNVHLLGEAIEYFLGKTGQKSKGG